MNTKVNMNDWDAYEVAQFIESLKGSKHREYAQMLRDYQIRLFRSAWFPRTLKWMGQQLRFSN